MLAYIALLCQMLNLMPMDETSALPACFQVKNDLLGIERFLALREHHYPFSKLHP